MGVVVAILGCIRHTYEVMAKKKSSAVKQITNRRARHDYDLGDGLVVGLQLSGAETKALRRGQGHIRGAYVTVKDGELWLINATITGDRAVQVPEDQHTRSRKLLAKKREIEQLIAAKQQGQTIVPLNVLTGGRYVKLRIAVGRGRHHYDKRHALKARDEQRTMQAVLKYQR
jgi:SsrA-binding protein